MYLKIEKKDDEEIGRVMWLTYSCDGSSVTDESLFEDRRRGNKFISDIIHRVRSEVIIDSW